MTPYLVQRATTKIQPHKMGIDSLLSFDYMGYAEFEFGSLPQSLSRIRQNLDRYVRTQIVLSHNGFSKSIDIFCKKEDVSDIHVWLQLVAKNEHRRCKGFLGLEQHFSTSELTRNGLSYRSEDFWWDIENDFFFWFTCDDFTKKFIEILKNYKPE